MHIGNKIFPYPTLNNNIQLSEYNSTSTYEIIFDTEENGEPIRTKESIVFKNMRFVLNNEELSNLYKIGKIKAALIIECSATTFRKMYEVTDIATDIIVPINLLKDTVNVSSYVYAIENINNYQNSDFTDDYIGYVFNIEKYDILAIDDGFKFSININPSEDNKLASIFTIVKKESIDLQMMYESTSNKINIFLSPEYYSNYDNMKTMPEFNNIVFSMIVIPALAGCLCELKSSIDDYMDIGDVIEQKRWFKSIILSYEKVTGSSLSMEEFKEKNSLELAQIVLNNATCNGIRDFHNLLVKGKGSEGAEEDE